MLVAEGGNSDVHLTLAWFKAAWGTSDFQTGCLSSFPVNFLSIYFTPFPGVFPVMEVGCCLQLGNSPIPILFSHLPE